MALKGNQFKANSFKSSSDQSGPEAPSRKRVFREKSEVLPKFDLHNGRALKIIGLVFLILSLYFLIAFTSYLLTWQDDQSYVSTTNGGWHNLFKTVEELQTSGVETSVVQNWLGKIGALLSNQFIYEWFGVSSFLFIFVFFVIGYRLLFKVKVSFLLATW